ncbi:hypothetical protein [uncultured Draconibacterium sp.]|uniref:hypothetical protein n=1 Tax=uncultured Draconibacterium sp. TaxID=1573823 RepID=UPI0032173A9B
MRVMKSKYLVVSKTGEYLVGEQLGSVFRNRTRLIYRKLDGQRKYLEDVSLKTRLVLFDFFKRLPYR